MRFLPWANDPGPFNKRGSILRTNELIQSGEKANWVRTAAIFSLLQDTLHHLSPTQVSGSRSVVRAPGVASLTWKLTWDANDPRGPESETPGLWPGGLCVLWEALKGILMCWSLRTTGLGFWRPSRSDRTSLFCIPPSKRTQSDTTECLWKRF